MKKTRTIAAAVAATLLIAACGGGDDDTAGSTAAPPTTATSSSATPDPTSETSATPDSGSNETDPVNLPSGGTFRWGTSTIPASMDPSQVGSDTHFTYFTPVYENLIRADASGDLIPGLAEEWTLSEDGLTFELKLRDGVTFQDGAPVDSAAVVANFDHYKAEGSLLAPLLTVVDSVTEVDTSIVRFSLTRPGGDMPEILRGYAGMMASPASIEAGTLATEPVGAGPFSVKSITDTMVTYERNTSYWDADSIHLDGIEITVMTDDVARLNAVRSGQLDGTFIRPNQAAEAEAAGLSTVTGPRVFTYGMYLNPASPEFADPVVRRAISLAVDRASIESFLYDDRCAPAAQLYPTEYWAYSGAIDDASYLTYDPESAKELIKSAMPDGLKFSLTTPAVTAYQRLAEVLQDQMGQIGVEVEIDAIDANEVFARLRAGEYSAIVTAFYAANPDPAAYAAQYYVTEPGGNEYIVPGIAESVEASRLTVDRDERAAAIGDISAAVLEEGTTAVAICIPDVVFAFSDQIVGLDVPILGNYDFRAVAIVD